MRKTERWSSISHIQNGGRRFNISTEIIPLLSKIMSWTEHDKGGRKRGWPLGYVKIHKVVWNRDLSEETAQTELEHKVEGQELR